MNTGPSDTAVRPSWRGPLALSDTRLTRLLLWCGVIGPLLFIVAFLLEGATRPNYSAWRDYVSDLSLSNQGWEQIANFLVCGLLCAGFASGLRRALGSGKGATWGPLLLAVFGVSLVIAGIFVTDPNLGYPPGALLGGPQTVHGTIHGVNGLIAFGSVAAAAFVLARRFAGDARTRGWMVYSLISGALVVLGFIGSTVFSVLDERGILPNAPTGLIQRIGIIAGWGWVALLAYRLLRTASRPGAARS
jgi:hypothetical protein